MSLFLCNVSEFLTHEIRKLVIKGSRFLKYSIVNEVSLRLLLPKYDDIEADPSSELLTK